MTFKALFIDIDDTLLRMKTGDGNPQDTGSLMTVLVDAGVELGGLKREESERRVHWVKNNVSWWSWDHFIDKLDIPHELFWAYAFNRESRYLEATEPNLPTCMKRLKKCGLTLFITSNNPDSGIRHKLRLAGFLNREIDQLFTQILGATELESMKWDDVYWKRAVEASGFSEQEIAVVGDNLKDDHEVPTANGLSFTFLIDPKSTQAKTDTLRPVSGFKEIAGFFEATALLTV